MQQDGRQDTAAARADEHADDGEPAGQAQNEQQDGIAARVGPPQPEKGQVPQGPQHTHRDIAAQGPQPELEHWQGRPAPADLLAQTVVDQKEEQKARPEGRCIPLPGNMAPKNVTAISTLRPLTAKGVAAASRWPQGRKAPRRRPGQQTKQAFRFSIPQTATRAQSDGFAAYAPSRKNAPPGARGSMEKGIASQVPVPNSPQMSPKPSPAKAGWRTSV